MGLGLVAALYVLSFPYHPALRSPNELCRMWQSRSLIDDGTLHINGSLQRYGMVGDLSCTAVVQDAAGKRLAPCVGPDAPRANVVAAWYYPSKAPLVSFLGAPVYWVQKKVSGEVSELSQVLWGRLFVTIAPTLALLVLLRRFLAAYVSDATATFFTVVYALGTMAFSYAEAFMSHQVTGVLLFSAFYAAWKVERGEWKDWGYAVAGLAAGAAVVAEYTAALGVLCVAAFTVAARWKQWPALARAAGLVVAGSAPMLGFLLWYHDAVFGSPFASGYKYLNDAAYMSWHQGGFLGIKTPDLRALWLSFFSPLRGFFAISPFLIVSFFGVRDLKLKDRALFVMVVAVLVSHTYFTSSFNYDSWGWTVGPRHLTGILPFLMLPAALVFERLSAGSPLKAGVVAGLGVSSMLVTGVVTFVNYVPPELSTSFFALALPLFSDGLWPVSWLAAFVPNPASGIFLLVLLGVAVAWAASFVRRGRSSELLRGVIFGALLHLVALRVLTRNDASDVAAKNVVAGAWVAPAGTVLQFGGRR